MKRLLRLLTGTVLVLLALIILWRNETRFNLYRAAAATSEVASLDAVSSGSLISWTGPMDPGLTIPGEFIDRFNGFLAVSRKTDIYCWRRKTYSGRRGTIWDVWHGRVERKRGLLGRRYVWRLGWSTKLNNNRRNQEIERRCKPKEMLAAEYRIGALPIESRSIQFSGSHQAINPRSLRLSETGSQLGMAVRMPVFYLSKGEQDRAGDERVRYTGIVAPRVATYFGKLQAGRGVAHRFEPPAGLLYQIFADPGTLHLIVAGDRATALASLRLNGQMQTWTTRGLGTALFVLGVYVLIGWMTGFLFHLPTLRWVAESGRFVSALVIGLPVAILVMAAAYLIAHPWLLVVIAIGIAAAIGRLWWRARSSQQALQRDLTRQYGHPLEAGELKDLEFLQLAQLAISHEGIHQDESKVMRKWAKKHRWNQEKYDSMIARARDKHDKARSAPPSETQLCNLIRLAMADGTLAIHEMQSILKVSEQLGYDRRTIETIVKRLQRSTTGIIPRPTKKRRRPRNPLASAARRKK
ncbi:TMEM43 family protein [Rosistilla ulvae]|nr:TMEM43 family protein [Rosistilla ulvae]